MKEDYNPGKDSIYKPLIKLPNPPIDEERQAQEKILENMRPYIDALERWRKQSLDSRFVFD